MDEVCTELGLETPEWARLLDPDEGKKDEVTTHSILGELGDEALDVIEAVAKKRGLVVTMTIRKASETGCEPGLQVVDLTSPGEQPPEPEPASSARPQPQRSRSRWQRRDYSPESFTERIAAEAAARAPCPLLHVPCLGKGTEKAPAVCKRCKHSARMGGSRRAKKPP